MLPLATHAPAKINLTLHIIGRRTDGYHELESLVAFAGTGDGLRLAPGDELTLGVEGPTASAAGRTGNNLVLQAANELRKRVPGLRLGAFRLVKRLPVAAGIGGGSSDAAAALRLLARLNGLSPNHPALFEAAQSTGADVPACLMPRARMMGGAGEKLGPPLKLPRIFAVLVNPGVPVATAAVFHALGLRRGERLSEDAHPEVTPHMEPPPFIQALRRARNDLERSAISIAPAIADALCLLGAANGCRLSRMSGSGATVFGLFDDRASAVAARTMVHRARPGWWAKATSLR